MEMVFSSNILKAHKMGMQPHKMSIFSHSPEQEISFIMNLKSAKNRSALKTEKLYIQHLVPFTLFKNRVYFSPPNTIRKIKHTEEFEELYSEFHTPTTQSLQFPCYSTSFITFYSLEQGLSTCSSWVCFRRAVEPLKYF